MGYGGVSQFDEASLFSPRSWKMFPFRRLRLRGRRDGERNVALQAHEDFSMP